MARYGTKNKESIKTPNKYLKEFKETLQIQGENLDRAIGNGEAQLYVTL
jgi:hypothetical protein